MCKDSLYKFNVKKLINKLPAEDAAIAKKKLPDMLGISRQTFSKILNSKASSRYSPTMSVMIQIASFLKVPIEELYANPPKEINLEDVIVYKSEKTATDLNLTA